MSRTRIRTKIAFLVFVLLPSAAGVVAVHASPTCERFVRTYVTKPVRNQVSKATAAAWAKWRVGHPNWKPNPDVHRPKYIMTREESVKKVEFACTMPTDPAVLDLVLTPSDVEPPLTTVQLPPMEATQINFPDVIPPQVSEMPPEVSQIPPETPGDVWPPFAPYIPPILGSQPEKSTPGAPVAVLSPLPPPAIGATPEPPSFLLAALGISCLGLFMRAKRRRTI